MRATTTHLVLNAVLKHLMFHNTMSIVLIHILSLNLLCRVDNVYQHCCISNVVYNVGLFPSNRFSRSRDSPQSGFQ